MPKLDLAAIQPVQRTGYPPPHDRAVQGRWQKRFAKDVGFEQLGANHVTLEPGAWSSQRHWHFTEDELVVMLSGSAVLVEDEGETELHPGDVCVWPAGVANGHCIQNRSAAPCSFLAVSAGPDTGGSYSDIDMCWGPDGFTRKDGTKV
ncbi:MAG: cupin domain-containing protein [Erythrobacter sp.]|nr:MAG: cupin domain-containing protein [Erythrobacter sp.]